MAIGNGAAAALAKTASPVKDVTTASFRADVLTASQTQPVLVDFWAPWCGPCRMMAPSYEKAAQRLEPGLRVAKLNTEEAQQIAAQFDIQSIPTLALFKGGREVARKLGAMDATVIEAWVKAKS